jgi:hypothetical protein
MKTTLKMALSGLVMLPLCVQAQYIKLVGNAERDALYFNLDRVWNYNLYEHSRWGGGLMYAHNWGDNPHYRFSADAYVGYGVRDEHLKWGATLDLMRNAGREHHLYLAATYDIAKAGSRRLEDYSLLDFTGNTGYMGMRMVHLERVAAGWRGALTRRLTTGVEAAFSAETDLFCSAGLLYPTDYHDTAYAAGRNTFVEGRLSLSHRSGLKGELKGGTELKTGIAWFRLLAQYSHTWSLGYFESGLYAQAGLADGTGHRVPYSRKFDLGGSLGCPIGLRNTLMTAAPGEFATDAFVLAIARIKTAKPLFDVYNRTLSVGSRPTPFVQVAVTWGALWGQDADGVFYCPLSPIDRLPLQAPHYGLGEVAAGLNGLLRWGMVDFGFSAAYRLTPSAASYNRTDPRGNLALTVSAVLSL